MGHNALKKHDAKMVRWLKIRANDQFYRVHRARNKDMRSTGRAPQYHAQSVYIWQGGEPEIAICTSPPVPTPSLLCFNENSEQTTAFLAAMRDRMLTGIKMGGVQFVSKRKPNGIARIKGYADFSHLAEISLGAAVVLAADYDRISKIVGQVPPTIDLHKWQDGVVTKLFQLGFFNLLGHQPSAAKLIEDGPSLTMRIVCGENADQLGTVDESLQELGVFLAAGSESDLDPTIVKVLTTISEAITNVTQHAYNDEHEFEHEHVNSFWVGATADRRNSTLTVAVFDQGATIPLTYPRLNLKDKAIRFLRSAVKDGPDLTHRHDGTYIRAAMRYGGSRTNQAFRGKGLPQMFRLMQSVGSGKMSVRSRGGWCTRNSDGRMTQGFIDDSIGGTLVEWTIELGDSELGQRYGH